MILSYIIPLYNGSKTIIRCLDSIYASKISTSEFEVIVVDDCSADDSVLVVKQYALTHPNIHIIQHEENKCQGGAKNTGIKVSQGLFIAFADQDDTIIAENMRDAVEVALQKDVDMLACHYNVQQEDGLVMEFGIDKGDGLLMSGKEFCEQYFQTGRNLAPWANLYKRDFLKKVERPFEEKVVLEDADWIAWHWIHADKVSIFNRPIYTWIMNPLSVTHSQHFVNRADWIKYGYRKISDAQQYRSISILFSDLMVADGRNNISGGMKKVWKVNNYVKFYQHLSKELPAIQKMEWHGRVKFLIDYPTLSIIALSIIGPILKTINYARCKFFK